MTRTRSLLALLALLLLTALPASSGAAKRGREIDLFWTRPDYTSFHLESIAMLSAANFENVGLAERHAEGELMKAIRGAGYRWITASTAKEMLRRSPSGDSLVRVIRGQVLETTRVDSASTAGICARLRVDGLITVRVDRAEQLSIQSDQSGNPTTTVQVHAVLVDSLGHLLWTASGTQVQQGPYIQATNTNPTGASGQLGSVSLEQRNNAPDWPLAFAPLFERWAPNFPARGAAPAAADSAAAH